TLGFFFGLVAVRPAKVSRVFVVLVSLSPALTAILLYSFIGAIMPAHLLVIASALAVSAALLPAHPQPDNEANGPIAIQPQRASHRPRPWLISFSLGGRGSRCDDLNARST